MVVGVAYWVPDGAHGGDAAGRMVGSFLDALAGDPDLMGRYMQGVR